MNVGTPQRVTTVTLPAGLDVTGGGGSACVGAMNVGTPQRVTLPAGLDVSLVGSADLRQGAARQRKYNFSFKEKDLLVTLIERHGDVVESRTGDGVTIEQKVAAWTDIQARFNEQNGAALERSVTELKKCYWNLKQKTKKALDAGREAGATARVDRVLWRIAQLAPEQFEGLLDGHCEVVDAPPEHEYRALKQEAFEMSDWEASNTSRVESPGRSQTSAPSPPAELDMYPIPSDYLSVELGAPPAPAPSQQQPQPQPQPQPQRQPAIAPNSVASLAEQWRAAAGLWTPPGLPDLHRLVNGTVASAAG
ncbi:uncharacterized protein LOC119108410 [Pollicipes pollicipes]|uniref:uncharacterized protein LOC119108410 n=1 Tax=Pollicipes pollicipes TaxID=41117 RepID=UPI00188572ED|nr:uncharacterized protein LOC119108410 [Pollicipes pollicipes]